MCGKRSSDCAWTRAVALRDFGHPGRRRGIAGCDPTKIPVATVYDIAERERNRRQAEIDARQSKTPEGQAAVTHRRSMEMIEHERRRLEREAAKTGKLDVARMDRLASAQSKLNRGQPRPPASPAPRVPTARLPRSSASNPTLSAA
jgi:hypothetical protein